MGESKMHWRIVAEVLLMVWELRFNAAPPRSHGVSISGVARSGCGPLLTRLRIKGDATRDGRSVWNTTRVRSAAARFC
jgi:hypothetical protein